MKPRKPRPPGQRRDRQQDPNRSQRSQQRSKSPRYDSESLSRSRGLSIHSMDQSVIQSFENSETLTGRRPSNKRGERPGHQGHRRGPGVHSPDPYDDIRAQQRAEGLQRRRQQEDEFDDNAGNRAPGNERHEHRGRGPRPDRSIKVWRPEGEQQASEAAPAREQETGERPQRGGRHGRHQQRDRGDRGPRVPGSGLHRSRRRLQRQEEEGVQSVEGAEVAGEKPGNAQRRDETRIHGVNACRAFFDKRKDDLIRVYLTQERSYEFTDVMKHCVDNRLAYHIIPANELSRAAESEHHEGVCFLIRKRVTLQLEEWLATLPKKGSVRTLAMDQVGNSHNIGAVMRTAAHFGVDAVLISAGAPIHNGSAARTAEGGFESLTLVEYRDHIAAMQALRDNGFDIIATAGDGDSELYEQKLPKRAVIFFGEEKEGLAQTLLDGADMRLRIPGSGQVQSLNVSCAAAVVLGEWFRTTRKKPVAAEIAEPVVEA